MHAAFPIAIAPTANDRRTVAPTRNAAMRQFFSPCVLAFLSLAVAIGAYGYGYKLSQYLDHSGVIRASHTRIWVEHRDDSLAASVHHQHQPHKVSGSQPFALSFSLLPSFSRNLVLGDGIQSRILSFVSPLHPLRAPPASLSPLA